MSNVTEMIPQKFRYISRARVRKILLFKRPQLLLLSREKTAASLFSLALLLNFFSSIHVLYLWPVETLCPVLTTPLCLGALLIVQHKRNPLTTRKEVLVPTLLFITVMFYQNFVNDQNMVPYVIALCNAFLLYMFFSLDKESRLRNTELICKVLAGFLVISLTGYLLYLVGFPLPSIPATRDNYSYTNHLVFLLDDRELWTIIPRFHSVFLEPGHMGTTIILLLATQIGQWKRWYNVVLFIALLASFSLAAYGLLVILAFLRLWIMRKAIVMKIILLTAFIGSVVGGSFIYNNGDNLLNQLIVMRLEMKDTGDDIEGNNRVSDDFAKEFDRYILTEEAIFGKDWHSEQWGLNSGYRVYIYDYGLMGFALVLLFYFFSFRTSADKRCIISAFILALANFWIRGYPLIIAFYLPYFLFAHLEGHNNRIRKEAEPASNPVGVTT